MSLSIRLGNILYKKAFFLYRPLYHLFKNKQDAFEISLLKKVVVPGAVVVDIGANIGFYASILSSQTGQSGTVHCFEPDEKNFEKLQVHTRDLANVRINNKAIGPVSGKIRIYTSKELNVDHRTYRPDDYATEKEIESVSLDDYLSQTGNHKVDLIKMDIQGFEMQAVQGMTRTFQNNPHLKIISEFWPYGLQKAGSSATEYYEWLQQKGFDIRLISNSSLEPLTKEKVQELEPLDKSHYYNILATRQHV